MPRPFRRLRVFERQKLYDKEAALRVSFNALLAEVQRKLYLILDSSQFRHITPILPCGPIATLG